MRMSMMASQPFEVTRHWTAGVVSGDVDPGVVEETGDAFTDEHHVVGDHDSHGISARRPAGSMCNVLPTADSVGDMSHVGEDVAPIGRHVDHDAPFRKAIVTPCSTI
jgi:hypothetical protein